MRYVVAVCLAALILTGCIGDLAEEASDECQKVLDERIPGLLADFEEICEAQIDDAIDDATTQIEAAFAEALDEALADAEVELLTRLGCTPKPETAAGWDCSASEVCP